MSKIKGQHTEVIVADEAAEDPLDVMAKALCTPHNCRNGILHAPMSSLHQSNHPSGVYVKEANKTWFKKCPLWLDYMKAIGIETNPSDEELVSFRAKCDKCKFEATGESEKLAQSYVNFHKRQKHKTAKGQADNDDENAYR